MKEGGRRGLQECENQFKNEIWNCTLNNKEIFRELPIFVKTTLPYGKPIFVSLSRPCLIPKGSLTKTWNFKSMLEVWHQSHDLSKEGIKVNLEFMIIFLELSV